MTIVKTFEVFSLAFLLISTTGKIVFFKLVEFLRVLVFITSARCTICNRNLAYVSPLQANSFALACFFMDKRIGVWRKKKPA